MGWSNISQLKCDVTELSKSQIAKCKVEYNSVINLSPELSSIMATYAKYCLAFTIKNQEKTVKARDSFRTILIPAIFSAMLEIVFWKYLFKLNPTIGWSDVWLWNLLTNLTIDGSNVGLKKLRSNNELGVFTFVFKFEYLIILCFLLKSEFQGIALVLEFY